VVNARGPSILELLAKAPKFQGFRCGREFEFKIRWGDVYGFLGPNGSGKSTTIRAIILGLVKPSSGENRVFDRPVGGPERREKLAGFVDTLG